MDESLLPKELRTKPKSEVRAKANKVVTHDVKVKKPGLAKKFADVFINEDIGSIKEYIIYDQIIPTVIRGFVDTVNNTLEMAFYGRVRGGRNRSSTRSNRYWDPEPQFSYDRFDDRYSSRRGSRTNAEERYSRRSNRVDEITMETLAEADAVMEEMVAYLERYGRVSVAAYYEACGVSSERPYTDENWGWTTLRNARVIRVRDGYTLELPKPEPL